MAVPDRSHDRPMIAPEQSGSRPALDFLLFAQQLFNFELERYRAASVPFVDRLFCSTYRSMSESWISVILARSSTVRYGSVSIVGLLETGPTIEHSRLNSAGG